MAVCDDLPPLHRAQTRSFGRAALTAPMTTSRSSSRLRSSTTKESALSRVQASSSSTAGTMRTPLMARLRWHIPALQRSCETTSNCQGPERLAGEKSSGHWLGLTGSFRGRPDAAPFPSTLSFARPLPSLSGPPFPSFVSFRGRRSEPSRARCPHPVTAPSPCETLILASLRTWLASFLPMTPAFLYYIENKKRSRAPPAVVLRISSDSFQMAAEAHALANNVGRYSTIVQDRTKLNAAAKIICHSFLMRDLNHEDE